MTTTIAAGFFSPNGIEYPLALFGANVAIALAGAGRYSLDSLIAARRNPAGPAPRSERVVGRAA